MATTYANVEIAMEIKSNVQKMVKDIKEYKKRIIVL